MASALKSSRVSWPPLLRVGSQWEVDNEQTDSAQNGEHRLYWSERLEPPSPAAQCGRAQENERERRV